MKTTIKRELFNTSTMALLFLVKVKATAQFGQVYNGTILYHANTHVINSETRQTCFGSNAT